MATKTIWDKHGNRLGEDVITTDRDSLIHITHYDNNNQRIGRSYQTRERKGEIYVIHEDANGHIIARSTVEHDWWGDYYTKTTETAYSRDAKEQERQRNQTDTADNDENNGFPVADLLYSIFIGAAKLLIGFQLFSLLMAGIPLILLLLIPTANSFQWGKGFFWVAVLFQMAYEPYLVIMLWRKFKKRMTWGGVFKHWLLWLLVGPFAYVKLLKKGSDPTKKPGVMPYLGYCASCKRQELITIGPAVCSVCGTKLIVPPPKDAEIGNRLCPKCSRSCRSTDKFCPYCGQDINLHLKLRLPPQNDR